MSGSLLPTSQQWMDDNGNPLANGLVYTYIAGTTSAKTTYSDYALTTTNANPVVLDASGRANIWGYGGYKLVIKNSGGSTLYTQDNVFVSGASTSVTGDFSQTGGRVSFNTTAYTATSSAPASVYIRNDNVYNNSTDTYGSGSITFDRSYAVDNNQPHFFVYTNVSSTSIGNTAWFEFQNLAGVAGRNSNWDRTKKIGGSGEMTAVNYGVGAINTVTITNAGSSYTNGTYTSVPLTATSGTGVGAYATVVVSGGIVTSVTPNGSPTGGGTTFSTGGTGAHWGIGDTFSIAAANVGGTGTGFIGTVLYLTSYTGKLKLGVSSSSYGTASTTNGGYVYLGTRRSPLDTVNNANTGFTEQFRIHSMDLVGQGQMQSDGNGLYINPIYDFGAAATISLITSYNSARIVLTTNAASQPAIVEVTGQTGTYIRARATAGTATNYTQADAGTGSIAVRANWTTPGTSSAQLNLQVDNTSNLQTGWQLATSGQTGATLGTLGFTGATAGSFTQYANLSPTTSVFGLQNNANPGVSMASNTATTGRNFSITSNGTSSALTFFDSTNSTVVGSFKSSDAGGKFTANYGVRVSTGAATTAGTATLVAGVATVTTTGVTANSKVFVSYNTTAGTTGVLRAATADITAGTSFVIRSSSGTDTSTVNWWVVDVV